MVFADSSAAVLDGAEVAEADATASATGTEGSSGFTEDSLAAGTSELVPLSLVAAAVIAAISSGVMSWGRPEGRGRSNSCAGFAGAGLTGAAGSAARGPSPALRSRKSLPPTVALPGTSSGSAAFCFRDGKRSRDRQP